MLKVAILASGGGSIATALANTYRQEWDCNPLLVTNRAASPIADKGILLDQKDKEQQLLNVLFEYECDWLLLAGYMKILSPDFIRSFSSWHKGKNQIVNIHPSYLPELKGKDAYLRAWESERTQTGISLHYVNDEVDGGEIIYQEKLEIDRTKEFDHWVEESKRIERMIFCSFLQDIMDNKVKTEKFSRIIK